MDADAVLAQLCCVDGARCGCFVAPTCAWKAVQIGGQALDDAALGHLVAEIDGAGEAERIGAAVALDGDAVEAQERCRR